MQTWLKKVMPMETFKRLSKTCHVFNPVRRRLQQQIAFGIFFCGGLEKMRRHQKPCSAPLPKAWKHGLLRLCFQMMLLWRKELNVLITLRLGFLNNQ